MKRARALRRTLGPAIDWAPAHDAYYIVASMRPGAAGIPRLHVTQRALLQLYSQMERRHTALPFGLLSGALCLAPESSTHYLLIDEVVAARRALTADEPLKQLSTELRALAAEAERGQKLALGWYLGGMDGDLEVDPEVAALHHELFGEAWQIMLVSGRAAGAEQGEFRRFESQSERFYPIPFSELLQETARRREASEPRTVVRWTHYRTTQPVSYLDPSAIADLSANTQPSRGRELHLGAFLRSLRRGGEHTPTDDTSSAVDAPSPRARTPLPAAAPARPPELNGPVSPPSNGSAVRRIDAATRAQAPTPAPAPTEPALSAPPYLSIAKRTSDVPLVPAPVVRSPRPAPPAAAARETVPPVAVPDPEVPQIFINGVLVALPDTNAPLAAAPPPDTGARRFLPTLLGAVLIVLAGLAVYLSFR